MALNSAAASSDKVAQILEAKASDNKEMPDTIPEPANTSLELATTQNNLENP